MNKTKNKNLRITTRVDEEDRNKLEQLIKEGKYKNLSQIIRTALRQLLSTQTGERSFAAK